MIYKRFLRHMVIQLPVGLGTFSFFLFEGYRIVIRGPQERWNDLTGHFPRKLGIIVKTKKGKLDGVKRYGCYRGFGGTCRCCES